MYSKARKLLRLGMPLVAILIALCLWTVALADDGDLVITGEPVDARVELDGSVEISYTLQNSTTDKILYYNAVLEPGLSRCSKGIENAEGAVVFGETRVVTGLIQARCYEKTGTKVHVLRVSQISGPNKRDEYTKTNQITIPITVTVQPSLLGLEWKAGSYSNPPSVIGVGDPYTYTVFTKNMLQRSNVFTNVVKIYQEPTDKSFTPVVTTGSVHYLDENKGFSRFTWTGELAAGETATMTIATRGGPFVGAYPGSVVSRLANNAVVSKGIIVLATKPTITDFSPEKAVIGEKFELVGRHFDTEDPYYKQNSFIVITDPQTQRVTNIYAADPSNPQNSALVWEDNRIKFVVPQSLQYDYCYWIRVYRGFIFALSEPVTICTAPAPVDPEPMQFEASLNPQSVESGSIFTATFVVTNTSAVTQSVLTTITLDGGAIDTILRVVADGEYLGLSGTTGGGRKLMGPDDFATYYWSAELAPGEVAKFMAVATAVEVSEVEVFLGTFSWETSLETYLGALRVTPKQIVISETYYLYLPDIQR